jgi:hypothetical protein
MWQINAQGSRFFRHVQRRHVQLKKLDLGMNLSPWFSQDSHGCFPKQNHGWFSLLLHHFAWRVMGKPCEFSFIGVNVAQFQCRTLPALFECPKSATCSMSSLVKMRLPSLTALTPAKRSIMVWIPMVFPTVSHHVLIWNKVCQSFSQFHDVSGGKTVSSFKN